MAPVPFTAHHEHVTNKVLEAWNLETVAKVLLFSRTTNIRLHLGLKLLEMCLFKRWKDHFVPLCPRPGPLQPSSPLQFFFPFSSSPPPSSGTSCQNRERWVQKRPDDTMFCSFLASDSQSLDLRKPGAIARNGRIGVEGGVRRVRGGKGGQTSQVWYKATFTLNLLLTEAEWTPFKSADDCGKERAD